MHNINDEDKFRAAQEQFIAAAKEHVTALRAFREMEMQRPIERESYIQTLTGMTNPDTGKPYSRTAAADAIALVPEWRNFQKELLERDCAKHMASAAMDAARFAVLFLVSTPESPV
jgi:hypothetical protein